MFITFEGSDGSGKTTQIRLAAEWLREQGYEVLLTREPGGTRIGDRVRALLLEHSGESAMQPRTELLLFCASRAQLVAEVIRPWLSQGGIVLCDRYADSTLAYQGYGHGLDLSTLRTILDFATASLKPDLTIFLDLDPELGLIRRRTARFQGEDWNRMDEMELAFHRRVYAGYAQLIAQEPQRWVRIQADAAEEDVQMALRETIRARLQGTLPSAAPAKDETYGTD